MNKQASEILQFVLLCLSIGSVIVAVISWYSASVQKRYASQRDFEHLKRNYQQLSEGLTELTKEVDKRFDENTLDMRDLKNVANAILLKISTDTSIGWGKREG